MISSPTLEFKYVVSGWPQDGNVSLRINIGGIVVHSRFFVDNPNGSAYGGHDLNLGFIALNATNLPLKLRLTLQSPNMCRAAGQSR